MTRFIDRVVVHARRRQLRHPCHSVHDALWLFAAGVGFHGLRRVATQVFWSRCLVAGTYVLRVARRRRWMARPAEAGVVHARPGLLPARPLPRRLPRSSLPRTRSVSTCAAVRAAAHATPTLVGRLSSSSAACISTSACSRRCGALPGFSPSASAAAARAPPSPASCTSAPCE